MRQCEELQGLVRELQGRGEELAAVNTKQRSQISELGVQLAKAEGRGQGAQAAAERMDFELEARDHLAEELKVRPARR